MEQSGKTLDQVTPIFFTHVGILTNAFKESRLNLDVWYDKIFVLGYVGHADQLAPTLKELTRLEKESQNLFLHRFYNTQLPA